MSESARRAKRRVGCTVPWKADARAVALRDPRGPAPGLAWWALSRRRHVFLDTVVALLIILLVIVVGHEPREPDRKLRGGQHGARLRSCAAAPRQPTIVRHDHGR